MELLLIFQLWTSVPDRSALLQGNWQSCIGSDGHYEERIYDRVEGGKALWSLHMGPKDDFALFQGTGPEGDADDHDSPLNLLTAHHVSSIETLGGRRAWNIPSLNLWISIVEAGGSRGDCASFFVRVAREWRAR